VASIGDKPLPVVTGEPGAQLSSDEPPLDRRRDIEGRVSGRVVDAEGKPVPRARVRLAVGDTQGGRDLRVATDRSGAFTLHGLRPNKSYTLIAEWDDEKGDVLTGREEIRAPDTNVRISLNGGEPTAPVASARPRVNPISGRSAHVDDEPEAEEPRARTRQNEEDLEPAPAAEDARSDNDEPGSHSSAVGSARRPTSAWRNGAGSRASTRQQRQVNDEDLPVRDEQAHETHLPFEPVPELEDEGPNPLPPAIEQKDIFGKAPGSASVGPRSRRDAPSFTERELDPWRDLPAPERATRTVQRGEIGRSREPSTSSLPRPGRLVAASVPRQLEPVPPGPSSVVDSAADETSQAPDSPSVPAPGPRPTWRQVVATMKQLPPLEEESVAPSPRDPALAMASRVEPATATSPTPSTLSTGRKPAPDAPRSAESLKPFCRFDSRHLQIDDFQLPDIHGGVVRFQDLDADLILLDFWGTWCASCRPSNEHLRTLQKRYDPKKLQVVGVACEQGPLPERVAAVTKAVAQQDLNYRILLSSNDGSCPLQEALHIQAFPTLILVDRQGHVLWRDQGSTHTTLARLDRVLASATKPAQKAIAKR
jgi:thiol-disulfide isomerase/thioredoxin